MRRITVAACSPATRSAAALSIPVAFTFLTVGITLKLALFPLHLWLPNAYTYAPSAVTAFIASTATKVSVYLLLRFFFTHLPLRLTKPRLQRLRFGGDFTLPPVPR